MRILSGVVIFAASLKDIIRACFVLSRFHELSNEEIASILLISPQTVANQLVGAMRTLRLLLRSRYEEHAYPPLKVVRDRDLLTG